MSITEQQLEDAAMGSFRELGCAHCQRAPEEYLCQPLPASERKVNQALRSNGVSRSSSNKDFGVMMSEG